MTSRKYGRIRQWTCVSLLGLCHGFGDFNAGLLLAIIGRHSGSDIVVMYLLYNILAFVGQPFAGLICDRLGHAHRWFHFGCLLSLFSLYLVWDHPELAITCSGIASAFYHSSGGSLAWKVGDKKVLVTGLFTAPGVFGLALGLTIAGQLSDNAFVFIGVTFFAIILILARLMSGIPILKESYNSQNSVLDTKLIGSIFGWLIILAIAARSFAWSMSQQSIFPIDYAVKLALAAAFGKLTASLLADRFGSLQVSIFSLTAAAILLAIGDHSPLWFFPAVIALQGSTGPMMAIVLQAWPRFPAFGSGLAQGLAVAIGGAPILILSTKTSITLYAAIGALALSGAIIFLISLSNNKRLSLQSN